MKIRRRFVLLTLAATVVLGVGAAVLEFIVLRGVTPHIDTSGSISSLEKHVIGGVEQWILIRGHDRSTPVVLFLHGGPGMPVMYLAHAFQRALEHDYVVVHWDRRGAGKSFGALSQMPALSVSQTLEDAYELTRILRARFGQQRIYLVGHSWGSYLGLLAVQRHPEYYSAFIGTGQLAGTDDQVQALRREFLYQVAQTTGDAALQARAEDQSVEITEDDLFSAGGELFASRSYWPLLKAGLAAPEYTLRDVLNVKKGADLVGREMKYDLVPKPSDGEIRKVDVPVFFFLGLHDFNTPSQLAAQYLDRLDAPLKRSAWFKKSAHFPFFEEPERFHEELLQATQAAAAFWSKESSSKGAVPPAAVERGAATHMALPRRCWPRGRSVMSLSKLVGSETLESHLELLSVRPRLARMRRYGCYGGRG
jgi:pimeloyl-ACP methyl ester carboxylesterase